MNPAAHRRRLIVADGDGCSRFVRWYLGDSIGLFVQRLTLAELVRAADVSAAEARRDVAVVVDRPLGEDEQRMLERSAPDIRALLHLGGVTFCRLTCHRRNDMVERYDFDRVPGHALADETIEITGPRRFAPDAGPTGLMVALGADVADWVSPPLDCNRVRLRPDNDVDEILEQARRDVERSGWVVLVVDSSAAFPLSALKAHFKGVRTTVFGRR